MTYDLYAERDCCEPRLICVGAGLEKLAEYVEQEDMAGAWPEGFDAVARPSTGPGLAYLFTDGWELLS